MQRAPVCYFSDEGERIRNHDFSSYQQRLVIDDPLALQLLKKPAALVANCRGIRSGELLLQFRDDPAESALAVALLQQQPSGALQLDCAFGKEDYAFLFTSSPAAPRGESWLASF